MYVDDIKLAGKKQNIDPMWKVLNKEVDLENQHLSLIMYTSDVLKDNVKKAQILLTIKEPCLNPELKQEQLQNYHVRKIFVFLRGSPIWKVMPRNVLNDIVSSQTR